MPKRRTTTDSSQAPSKEQVGQGALKSVPLKDEAYKSLGRVMADDRASAAAKVSAARAVIELSATEKSSERTLTEMSLADIDAEIDRVRLTMASE